MSNRIGLVVKQAGMFTQLQDTGRYGVAKQGLSQGGYCDELAAGWANYLLKNRADSCLLEITFGQCEFVAECDCQLALTGADMQAVISHLSGQKTVQLNNRSFIVKRGESLQLGFARCGMRAYLAVQGGFQAAKQYASNSTVARNAIGGLNGKGGQLQAGDRLAVLPQRIEQHQFIMPSQYLPNYEQPVTLGVIESYQADAFSVTQKKQFYSREYCISAQSDRMGMRLSGEPLMGELTGIISEGIALGSIQIAADGLPIILLQDRQTLGGYPKIGCVARCDLSLLAQQHVGKKIRFKPISLKDAQLRYQQRLAFFNVYR